MNKILIITGPTATGKTDLGIDIAQNFSGEIISADSRQVYKMMDVGTGKDKDLYEKAGVNVWGIDLVNPDYPFNVSEWVKYAIRVIREIWEKGKLPIVVGGTGLYIKELLQPSETLNIPPDKNLRQKLNSFSVSQLQQELQKTDPVKWQRMNESDKNNPRRLVRAIEVAGQKQKQAKLKANILIIGLSASSKSLYEKIDQRVEERINQGFAKEKEKLAEMGFHPNAIGYRGETTQEWKYAEHSYARRQLTFLKKVPGIIWFDISSQKYQQKIMAEVGKWYTGKDGGEKN